MTSISNNEYSDIDVADIAVRYTKLNIDDVSQTISRFCEPISVINERNKYSEDPSLRIYSGELRFKALAHRRIYDFIVTNTRWMPANPNKARSLGKLKDTYALLTSNKSFSESNHSDIANSVDEKGVFLFQTAIDNNKYIMIEGVRGIGKTAFLNYWLTDNTASLEASGKIWFRIDASKVYDIYPKKRGTPIEDIYKDYFYLHTLYVLVFYGTPIPGDLYKYAPNVGRSPAFSQIMSRLKENESSIYSELYNLVFDGIRGLSNKEKFDDFSRIVVANIQLNLNKNKRRTMYRAYKAFCSIINDMDLAAIVVIDGVDNISWTKDNDFYQKTCKNFDKILSELRRELGSSTQFIVAARPETVHEIRFAPRGYLTGFNDQRGEPAFTTWRIIPPPVEEIIAKKAQAIAESRYFEIEREALLKDFNTEEKKLFKSVISRYIEESRQYPKMLVDIVRNNFGMRDRFLRQKRLAIQPITYTATISINTVLSYLFDNDVRAYIDNLTNVFFTKEVFYEGSLTVSSRNRRLLQYIYLNGRPFFDSREHFHPLDGRKSRANYKDRGAVFPNPFWWPVEFTHTAPGLWHGLAGIRLLQCAKAFHEFYIADIIYFLHRIFSYELSVLIEAVETYVACGLIDIKISSNLSKPFFVDSLEIGNLKEYNNYGFITNKGKLMLEYIFLRPDILYFLALDTPLNCGIVEGDFRLVRPCREFVGLNYIEDFFRSAIPTVGTLLLHVKNNHRREIQSARRLLIADKGIKKYVGSVEKMVDAFSLPATLDDVFRGFVLSGIGKNRDSKITNEIKSQIVGELGGIVALIKEKGRRL